MHILLCLGNPRKKCNTLYGYVPAECPNQTSPPLFQASLTFCALPRRLLARATLSPHPPVLWAPSPGTAQPTDTIPCHRIPVLLLSPNHWLTPVLILHAHPLMCDTEPKCKCQTLHPEAAAAALDTHCKRQGRAAPKGRRTPL